MRRVDAAASVACVFLYSSLAHDIVSDSGVRMLGEDRIVLLDYCRSTALLFCTRTLVPHHLCVRHAAPQFCLFCVRQHRPS